jgi:hypothetical protein
MKSLLRALMVAAVVVFLVAPNVVLTLADNALAAPYLAVAAGRCRPGECGVPARGQPAPAYQTTLHQKRVLNRMALLLTPHGVVTGLRSVGDTWNLDALREATWVINSMLDGLPPNFFKGASPMVRGPDMLLDDFYEIARIPRVKSPQKHVMSLVHHLYRLYRASAKMGEVRNTTIRLVRDFALTTHVDPAEYPITKYGIPPLHTRLLLDATEDMVFMRVLLEHGNSSVDAYHPQPTTAQALREPLGMSSLAMVHHTNSEIFITKTLFVVADAMRKANLPTCEATMRALEAFEKISIDRAINAKISIGDFRGMFNDEYGADSDVWRRLFTEWDTDGPQQHVMKTDTHRLAEDISIAILKTLLGTSKQAVPGRTNVVDLNEIALRWPYDHRNVWHHLAILQHPRYFEVLAEAVKKQIREDEATSGKPSRLLHRLQQSMLQRERFVNRTPLMIAAVLSGSREHPMVAAMLNLSRWAGLDLHVLLNDIKDDYNNTAQAYLDGVGNFEHLDEQSAMVQMAGYTAKVNRSWQGPTTLSGTWEDDWDNGGGWERFPKRPDLDLPAGHVCGIMEVQGLPSTAEFARLVSLRKPVVFRGGMKDLHLPRSLWSLDNMKRKYGGRAVHVGLIPYLSTFASDMPGYGNTSHLEYKTTMEEYIANFRRAGDGGNYDDTTVPPYLFTSAFANENPTIYDEAVQGMEFLRNVTGLQAVTEGQFFVGEAATGAPVHWHNSAVNFLWYGRKRWVLFDPEQAFYSVKSSLTFFQNDLPDIRSKERKVFTAAEFELTPLEFVQEAGDIMLLPDYWGHGTLNLETTVGIAFEFHSMANKMFQTTSDGYVAMNIGFNGEYAKFDEFYKKHGFDVQQYLQSHAKPRLPELNA